MCSHSISRGEIQRVTTEGLQGKLQHLAGKTTALIPPNPGSAVKKPLGKATYGSQQQSSPSLVYIGQE